MRGPYHWNVCCVSSGLFVFREADGEYDFSVVGCFFLRERAAGLLRFTVSSVDRGLGVVCVYVYIIVHPLRITLTLFFVGYIDAVLDDRSTACSRLRGSCYVSCGSLGRKDGRTEERP